MLKNSEGSLLLDFFGTMRLLKILVFLFFFRKFFKDSNGFPFNFLKFCNRMVKKSQRAPFTVFGIVRNFKMNNFCLKIRFPAAQHAISEFVLFKDRRFFLCYFFLICFHRSPPPQFLLKMKRFASIKDCSRISALCDLPETFKKIFEKFRFFSLFFCF